MHAWVMVRSMATGHIAAKTEQDLSCAALEVPSMGTLSLRLVPWLSR